jgi:hypothetical protein
MSWTLCTSGAAIAKAGKDANATITASGATLAEWSNEAEGFIASQTREDWVAHIASVGTNLKGALADCASDIVAMKIINYDLSGYPSRITAETMLDVLRDNVQRNIDNLSEDKTRKFMGV